MTAKTAAIEEAKGSEKGVIIPHTARRERVVQLLFFGAGLLIVVLGLHSLAHAQSQPIDFNGQKFAEATRVILQAIEGSFGTLIMVSAGIGAILSSAFGQYRAALSLLVVSVGSFVLRSLVSTFFNTAELDRLN